MKKNPAYKYRANYKKSLNKEKFFYCTIIFFVIVCFFNRTITKYTPAGSPGSISPVPDSLAVFTIFP